MTRLSFLNDHFSFLNDPSFLNELSHVRGSRTLSRLRAQLDAGSVRAWQLSDADGERLSSPVETLLGRIYCAWQGPGSCRFGDIIRHG